MQGQHRRTLEISCVEFSVGKISILTVLQDFESALFGPWILYLQEYWASVGCAVMQCSNTEVIWTLFFPPFVFLTKWFQFLTKPINYSLWLKCVVFRIELPYVLEFGGHLVPWVWCFFPHKEAFMARLKDIFIVHVLSIHYSECRLLFIVARMRSWILSSDGESSNR